MFIYIEEIKRKIKEDKHEFFKEKILKIVKQHIDKLVTNKLIEHIKEHTIETIENSRNISSEEIKDKYAELITDYYLNCEEELKEIIN